LLLKINKNILKLLKKYLLFININIILKNMSKKSGKGKKSKNYDETEGFNDSIKNIEHEEDNSTNSAVELSYLTGAILDYYEASGKPSLDEGDEWKSGTEHEPKSRCNIPKEIDDAIKIAFLVQIYKFQK